MKRAIMTGLLAIGAACLLLGCGKKEEEVKEPEQQEAELKDDKAEKEEEKKDEKEYMTIGTESEGAYQLLLTNHTGGEITQLRIKASSAPEFPENMMAADMKIPVQETVRVYYTAPESVEEMNAEASGRMLLRTTYDISLGYEDGHTVDITGLGFDDMEEVELCFEDEVGFVKYVSAESGEQISTKETALALKAQREAEAAAAAAQAEAAAAAEAQAQTDAPQPVQQYEQTYYEEPAYQPEYTPDYSQSATQDTSSGQGSDVGQSGEGCLNDPVFRY